MGLRVRPLPLSLTSARRDDQTDGTKAHLLHLSEPVFLPSSTAHDRPHSLQLSCFPRRSSPDRSTSSRHHRAHSNELMDCRMGSPVGAACRTGEWGSKRSSEGRTDECALQRSFHSSRAVAADPYSVLGVGKDASSSDIKKSYYGVSRRVAVGLRGARELSSSSFAARQEVPSRFQQRQVGQSQVCGDPRSLRRAFLPLASAGSH